jgi:putative Holliday junction resolvase
LEIKRAGRILALDVGEKRIGLALSDPLWSTAQPLDTLKVRSHNLSLGQLAQLVSDQDISLIVTGLPIHSDGSESNQSEKVRLFAEAVAMKTVRPVIFFDERSTTREAERVLLQAGLRRKKRRNNRDKLAAVLILTYFLSSIPPSC